MGFQKYDTVVKWFSLSLLRSQDQFFIFLYSDISL